MLKRNLLPISILATALILLAGIYTFGTQENAMLSSVFNIVGAEECEGDSCQQQEQSQEQDEFVWWDLGFGQQQQQSQSQDGQQQQQQQQQQDNDDSQQQQQQQDQDGGGDDDSQQQQQQQQQGGDGQQQQQQQQGGDGQQQQQQQDQDQDQDQDPVCDDPNPGRDLVSSEITLVDRTAKATVTNSSDACTYNIGMASYKKFDEVIDNQELFDSVTTSIAPDSSKLLTVDYPECAAQIDVFYGELLTDLVGKRYGDRILKAIHTTDPYCQTPEEPSPEVTIVAKKVVCDAESDLPNWASGTQDIEVDATTAQDYVDASNGACRIVNFSFQWAKGGTPNPGDNTGSAGSPWTTFTSSAVVPLSALGGADKIWVREVYESKYIPFTGQNTTQINSAEMICHTDSINFDNYDYISNPVDGETYYCVAFNVLKTPDQCVLPTVEISRVSGDTSGKVGESFTHTFSVEATGDDTSTIEVIDLPAGLTYSASTKTISGTPTIEGTFKIKATAGNTCGTDTAEVSIVISHDQCVLPTVEIERVSGDVSGKVEKSFTYTFKVETTGDDTPTIEVTGLPNGLTYNTDTKTISGTPTIEGTFKIKASVDNTCGADIAEVNIVIGPKDTNGGGGSTPTALSGQCAVDKSSVAISETVTFTAVPTGGTGSYTYVWTGDDGLSTTSSSVMKAYDSAGTKNATVTITSGDETISDDCSVTVEVDGQGGDSGNGSSGGGGGGGGSSNRDLRLACEVSPTDPKVGSVITWTADAEYGRGDYTYFWTGTDGLSGNTEAIQKIYTTGGVKVASVVVESRNGDIESVVCTVTIPEPQVLGVTLGDVPYTGFSDNVKVIAFMVGLLVWSSAIGYFILRRFTRPTFAVDGHGSDEGEEEVSRIVYHNSPTYHEELYNRINGITPEDTNVKRFTDLLKF